MSQWSRWYSPKIMPAVGDYVQVYAVSVSVDDHYYFEGFVVDASDIHRVIISPRPNIPCTVYVQKWRKHLPPEEPKRIIRKVEVNDTDKAQA